MFNNTLFMMTNQAYYARHLLYAKNSPHCYHFLLRDSNTLCNISRQFDVGYIGLLGIAVYNATTKIQSKKTTDQRLRI